jgi:acyl dehydratase
VPATDHPPRADGVAPTGADLSTDADVDARLAAMVGQPLGGRGPSVAPDPVNQPMIRHWAAAFEDANPVYVDPDAAAASRFGEIVAPPLMLQTWTMATPKITGIAERGGSPVEAEGTGPLQVLDEAGYTGTLATNSEFEILRYLRLGDVVSAETVLESVSPEKATRLGAGRFVTWVTTYTDAHGEVVGRQTFRILKFRPGASPA